MLKLKKLQILGFKSFCDRTELKFHGDGIAAIIGPNGCGKSNIADAISWVLGEQSAKTLRGSRMEDVIFAGTRDRKPTGMAEVSLTLLDPEVYGGADALDPTEIEIQDEMPVESAAHVIDDWDEAAVRAHAARETERAVEDAQPGKTEEVEVPRGKINTLAIAFPEDEPRFAVFNWRSGRGCAWKRRDPCRAEDPAAEVQSAAVSYGRDCGYAAVISFRRQRISAERAALPAARYSGIVHGNGPGSGVLCAD